MMWTLSEFLNYFEFRSLTWCAVEVRSSGGISIPSNDFAYFHAVLEGQLRIAGAGDETIFLNPGDVVLILSGEAHALRTSTESHAEIIEFLRDGKYQDIPPTFTIGGSGPLAARVLCGRLKQRWPSGIRQADIPAVLKLDAAETMISVSDLSKSMVGRGAAGMLSRIACLMLALALRRHGRGSDLFPDSATDDPIALAMQLIDLHTAFPWTVASLAQKVGMGRSSFAAQFAAATGQTPIGRLAERRMQQAADMLQHGSLKIAEIAARVGYHSEAAFIRRFVAHFSITPGRMRASLQKRRAKTPDDYEEIVSAHH